MYLTNKFMKQTALKNRSNPHTNIWERSPMLRVFIPFALGIVISDRFGNNFNEQLLWVLIPLILIAFYCTLLTRPSSLQRQVHSSCNLIACIILGSYIASSNNIQQQADYIGHYKDSNALVVGEIIAPIKETEKTFKITINAFLLFSPQKSHAVSGKAFVSLFKKGGICDFKEGDTIIVPNQWQSISNTGNPFSFDYKQYCARKNIYLQQLITGQQITLFNQSKHSSVLQRVRLFCNNNINRYITHEDARALLKAMLLGDESEIDANIRQAYTDTGIIHIVSISGAHVALLFAVISFALGWIKQQRFAIIKYLLGLILIWLYVALAGAATPALRAAILFSIISLGTLAKQQRNPLNELMSAALVMLLFEPMWLFQIGFQLSFLAVLSLMLFYKPILQCWPIKHKIGLWLWKCVATSLAAEILIAPLVAFYFHSFPPMFLIANLVASLSMGIILILGLVLMTAGKISFIGITLGALITYGAQAFHYCIALLQGLNTNAFKTIYLSLGGMLLLYVFILFVADWRLNGRKKSLSIALTALCLFSIRTFRRSWDIAQQEKLIVYNVGKTTQCELVKGFHYSVISGNTEEDYTTLSAHIGLGTGHAEIKKENNFIINKQRICVIDSAMSIPTKWTTDVLIVCSSNKKTNPASIIQSIQAHKIVLGTGLNNWQIKQWQTASAEANIDVHTVLQDGAFLYPK